MNKEIISSTQGICTISMFLTGSFIVVGISSEITQDIWLSITLAFLMTLPMLYIYSKILMTFPGKNLFEILEITFGKIVGKIMILIYIWFFLHLCTVVMRNFSEFVMIISFPETPQYIFLVAMGLLAIWMAKSGVEVLSRWATFVFPIIWTVIIVIAGLSLTKANLSNLRPILYNGLKPIWTSSFAIFSFPFAEIFVFTTLLNKLKYKNSVFRVFVIGLLISGLGMLAITVRNILVLGQSLTPSLYFPAYLAVRAINIGGFIQRTEVVVAIVFIVGGVVKISVCLSALSQGVAKLFNISNYRYLVAPLMFVVINFAVSIYASTMEMFAWIKITPYYKIPFQIVLPIILLIGARIRLKQQKKRRQLPQ